MNGDLPPEAFGLTAAGWRQHRAFGRALPHCRLACSAVWRGLPRSGLLLDVPLEDRGTLNNACDVLAVRGLWRVEPGRDVRHHLEGALLDCRRDLLARLGISGLDPLRSQG